MKIIEFRQLCYEADKTGDVLILDLNKDRGLYADFFHQEPYIVIPAGSPPPNYIGNSFSKGDHTHGTPTIAVNQHDPAKDGIDTRKEENVCKCIELFTSIDRSECPLHKGMK